MTIVEIIQLANGGHRNQSGAATVPEGWALVPEGLTLEHFPFGTLEAEGIEGVMTVTSWTALPIPEPEPDPEPDPLEAVDSILVDHEYRITLMELGITDFDMMEV